MPLATSAASRWRAVIDDFQRSGLKQAEFCRRRGLSLLTFRKYFYGSRPGANPAPVVEFLAVTTPTSPAPELRRDSDHLVLILAGGRRVAIAPGFDAQTLKRLVETIEGLA